MTKKKKRRSPKSVARPPTPLLPRAGPPTNIRPGGPHADNAEKKREAAIRAALRRVDIDDELL